MFYRGISIVMCILLLCAIIIIIVVIIKINKCGCVVGFNIQTFETTTEVQLLHLYLQL